MYEEHSDRVYRIAYGYTNNEEDAQDIVQEVFLKVYLYIHKFRDLDQEGTISLIVICARNHSIDFLRKQQRRLKTASLTYEDEDGEVGEYDVPDIDFTPEEFLLNREMWQRIGGYIDSLPDGQRDVILLEYQFGMKDRDIARILKIKESAVSSRLNRARTKLRAMMAAEKD